MNWLAKLFPWKNVPTDRTVAGQLYSRLFASFEEKSGVRLAPETLTSVVGFSAGGPVALRTVQSKQIFITAELAMYQDQLHSADGLSRYELMTQNHFDENNARTLLTAIGAMSLSTVLGNRHTIDVSAITDAAGPEMVKLKLYSRISFHGLEYGIYEVLPYQPKTTRIPTL